MSNLPQNTSMYLLRTSTILIRLPSYLDMVCLHLKTSFVHFGAKFEGLVHMFWSKPLLWPMQTTYNQHLIEEWIFWMEDWIL